MGGITQKMHRKKGMIEFLFIKFQQYINYYI